MTSSGQAEITHYFWNEAGMDASLALENFVSDCVADWNDRPWQTAENVARTMEAAADQWEAEHADQVAPPVVWTARERVLA